MPHRVAPALLILALLLAGFAVPSGPAHAEGPRPGDASPVEGSGPGLQSVHNDDVLFGVIRDGKTEIALRICSPGPHFQIRSESIGKWMTEIFYRTQQSGGCSPSPTSWWRMVIGITPGTGDRFRIYVTSYETILSEADFMQRARRYLCQVPGPGDVRCARETVSAPTGWIDAPNAAVSGTVTVRGWAVDRASGNGPGVSEVLVRVSGRDAGALSYGQSRPDVGRYLGDSRFTPSGFSGTLDTTAFPNGPTTLQVAYRSALTGQWHSLERQVTIENTPIPTRGALRGRVLDAASGAPIAGAFVSLGVLSTRAAADGSYSFAGLWPGAYTLAASRDGYTPSTAQLTIVAGDNTRDIRLSALAAAGFRVPTSPIVSYPQEGGIVSSVNAYFDLDPSAGRIHDAGHPVGRRVLIKGRAYTAPWPADLWRLGLAYSGHKGTDFNGRQGQTDVIAAAPGYVLNWRDGDPNNDRSKPGNTVWMRHPNVRGRELCVVYHHLSPWTIPPKIKQAAGKDILFPAGEVLGKVGNSGYSFGAHLHFEVYDCKNTRVKIDPYSAGLMDGWSPPAMLSNEPPAPPSLTASASARVVLPGQAISLTVVAQAEEPVAQYRWSLGDGQDLAGAEASVSFAQPGTYEVWARMVTESGQIAVGEPLTILVTPLAGQANLDTVAPVATLTAPGATAASTVTLGLSLAAGEDVAQTRVRFSADGVTYTEWEQFTPERVWTLAEGEGLAMVYAQVVDAVGNVSSPLSAAMLVDRTAPTITLSEPIADPARPWQVSFAWDVEDAGADLHAPVASAYWLEGADTGWRNAGPERSVVYTDLAPGDYTLRVRVTDQAGNSAVAERTMTVTLPPGRLNLPLVIR